MPDQVNHLTNENIVVDDDEFIYKSPSSDSQSDNKDSNDSDQLSNGQVTPENRENSNVNAIQDNDDDYIYKPPQT
jgi:hypothetical protein